MLGGKDMASTDKISFSGVKPVFSLKMENNFLVTGPAVPYYFDDYFRVVYNDAKIFPYTKEGHAFVFNSNSLLLLCATLSYSDNFNCIMSIRANTSDLGNEQYSDIEEVYSIHKKTLIAFHIGYISRLESLYGYVEDIMGSASFYKGNLTIYALN